MPRPSCSTSGGQFTGGCREDVEAEGGVLVAVVLAEEWETCFFVRAAQSAKEVQDRHLNSSD